VTPQSRPLRRALDAIYFASGVAAAWCLFAIFVVMLWQAFGRELGFRVQGGDDISAWLTAASAFLGLAHTFKSGELVRVGLWLDKLGEAGRRRAEIVALCVSLGFMAWATWAMTSYVYDSWQTNELSQGLLVVPIWAPQSTTVIGMTLLTIAIADELILVLRSLKPTYVVAEEDRRARGDFSDVA